MRRKRNNKKKYTFLAIFLIADLLLIVTIFKSSNARFVSEATSGTELSVALYAVSLDEKDSNDQTLNINMDNLEPDGKERYYYFTVRNTNKDGFLTNTDLDYYLQIVTTTNIPLIYDVYEDSCEKKISVIRSNEILTDGSGSDAKFRNIIVNGGTFGHDNEESKSYCLSVTFPKQYNSAEYQNLIESLQVKVVTKQIM